jgi:putative ABC transport system permease protein
MGVDLGFNPRNLLLLELVLPNGTSAQSINSSRQLPKNLWAARSGLQLRSRAARQLTGGFSTDISIPGKTDWEKQTGSFDLCTPDYFRTVGFRLLRGSLLSQQDVSRARKVAVVNQTLARNYFAGRDSLGERVTLNRLREAPDANPNPSFTIIGVVADVANRGPEESAEPEAYIPLTVSNLGFPNLLVRTSLDSTRMVSAIWREIHAVDASAVQYKTRTVESMLHDFSYARPQFSVLLMGVFAAIGIVLVGTGVYGVMAYSVAQQTREIGIRMALGAERRDVFRTIVGMALRLMAIGVVLGSLASFATNRVISNEMWTIVPFDPLILIAGISIIVLMGFGASYLPALRAVRVSPVAALRHE